MSNTTKRLLDNLELNSSSIKHVHHNITCLFDLSDEILLLICRYLSPSCILYSFYTPSKPKQRLHRVIFDYYTNIKLDRITNNEYNYLSSVFSYCQHLLQLQSLILSNQHINHLINRYFNEILPDKIQSMFSNLKYLKLIDCSPADLPSIHIYLINLTKLENLYITIRQTDENLKMNYVQTPNVSIKKLVFDNEIHSLHTLHIHINNGLILTKSLISHQNIRNVNLILQTIDDLDILLDGIIPNVQTMIIQLCKSKKICYHHPQTKSLCYHLTQFTLLDNRVGLIISDIKWIFGYMPNLIQLTLSIRDTNDSTFCQGNIFESILIEYFTNLQKFDYTMTHRINHKTLIEDFIRWTMNNVFYENENCKWIHIYSLPWPSNKDDKRQLPFVKDGSNLSVKSDVKRCEYMKDVIITKHEQLIQLKKDFSRVCSITTCLSIDIKLPSRIYKLILSKDTRISSSNSICQSSIHHLIVKCRLNNVQEISIFAKLFPNVNYLELLFPLNESLYIQCFKSLFSLNNRIENKRCFWSYLINFSTDLVYQQLNLICTDSLFYDWLIENTDLKYDKYPFHVHCSFSSVSIWF